MNTTRSTAFGRLRRVAISAVVATVTGLVAGCETPIVNITEPPIAVMDDVRGGGREATPGRIVAIDYTVRLPDGREVLADRNYRFQLGQGAVIACVDDALKGMRIGGRRTIECPPHRHWGRQGYADIPPNTRLTIEIALLSVQ